MINFALDIGTTAAPESYLFYFLAPLSVIAALGMLLVKKAVHSALLLAWVMISLAIFYIAQDALFLGIVQIVVYTGAVMMLFLFILMLVGVDTSDSLEENIPGLRPVSIVAALGFGGLLVTLIGRATFGRPIYGLSVANAEGNAFGIAEQLFTRYVFAFEVVSALLITAALGAMVLGHSQKSKFRKDNLNDAAGLPAAGVYALHNAVDVPALLPTGKAAPTSISNVLQARGDMIESATFQMKSEEEEEK
jgi:NADH-quinone oxidoreductase subunit J